MVYFYYYNEEPVVQLVAHQTTYHYQPISNLGVGISERCFIFDFVSLPLEIARPILAYQVTKVAVKHQTSSNDIISGSYTMGGGLAAVTFNQLLFSAHSLVYFCYINLQTLYIHSNSAVMVTFSNKPLKYGGLLTTGHQFFSGCTFMANGREHL